ncbi:MAG: hypothetical protein V8R48_03175 [Eggerthella lenta]
MGTVAERWKIEAVLALVRQVEACDFFVAGEYNPSSKTRAFMRLVEFDYRDVRRIMRGLEVEDYCEGRYLTTKVALMIYGCSEPMWRNSKHI